MNRQVEVERGPDDAVLAALVEASARIGADPLLVQGAGGNTSAKLGDVLWIKASGRWLADATHQEVMVPVSLGALRAACSDGEDVENARRFLIGGGVLRPSIETAMHAMMPHRVVFHVHCVETIAVAIRRDAEDTLARALNGLDWCFIPYVRPGQPLADAIMARPGRSIYVYGNHGLTVGAETVEAATALVDTVHARLAGFLRPMCEADTEMLVRVAEGTAYEPATAAVSALGTDPANLAVARAGSLYPDHVIFLGRGVPERIDDGAPLVLVPGAGALLRRDASPAVRAMARCIADVARRVPEGADLRALTADEETMLLGWEAEAYRKTLVQPGS